MSVESKLFYSIRCDHDGCRMDTQELGDFAAWSELSQAVDHWQDCEQQVIEVDGTTFYYCDEHRVPQCSECEAPGQSLDVHPDGFCEKCAAEDEATA